MVSVGQALVKAGFVDRPIYGTVLDLLFAGRARCSPVEMSKDFDRGLLLNSKNTNPKKGLPR